MVNLPIIEINPRNSNLKINNAIQWKDCISEEYCSRVVPVFNLICIQRVEKVNQMCEEQRNARPEYEEHAVRSCVEFHRPDTDEFNNHG
jgi:hypothetical protein